MEVRRLVRSFGRRRDVKIRRKQIFEAKGANEAQAKIRRDKD